MIIRNLTEDRGVQCHRDRCGAVMVDGVDVVHSRTAYILKPGHACEVERLPACASTWLAAGDLVVIEHSPSDIKKATKSKLIAMGSKYGVDLDPDNDTVAAMRRALISQLFD